GLGVVEDLLRAVDPEVDLPGGLGLRGGMGQLLGAVVVAALAGGAGGGQQGAGVLLDAGDLFEELLGRLLAGGDDDPVALGLLGELLGGVVVAFVDHAARLGELALGDGGVAAHGGLGGRRGAEAAQERLCLLA